jgi:hypothetical protein
MAITAAVVVPSAGAKTVICGSNVAPCPKESVRPAGSWVIGGFGYAFSGSKFSLAAPLATLTCDEGGYFGFKSTAESGTPLSGVGENSLPNDFCHYGNSERCSAFVNQPPETMESTSGLNGTITIGTASQPLTIKFVCDTSVECNYAAAAAIPYTVKSPGAFEPAVGEIKEATMNRVSPSKGLSCFNTMKLNVVTKFVSEPGNPALGVLSTF